MTIEKKREEQITRKPSMTEEIRINQNLVLPPNFLFDVVIIVKTTHNLRQCKQPKGSNARILHAVNYMLKQCQSKNIR